MPRDQGLTCITTPEGNLHVALCPELDIASQGASIEEAKENLIEAVALFCETATDSEVLSRRCRPARTSFF
jgi:predicted RNase H-like HicB family nuclease